MTVNEKINIPDEKTPVVLLAPLDWGLGHATRCIPLIKHLLLIGCKVIIASEGKQQSLLKQEFNEIRFVHLKGYHIKYSNNSWKNIIKIILQFPKILISIKNENKWLRNFLAKNQIHAVISDNRYGLYNNDIVSAFITHQLIIKSPFGYAIEKFIQKLNYNFIEKFNECWVPDYRGGTNLASEMSHPVKPPNMPIKYLGRLSRMKKFSSSGVSNELLIILSGPEPQRSIFENILLKQLGMSALNAVMVRGLPGEEKLPVCKNKKLVIYNHLSAEVLNQQIIDSKIIISRSGYSTVMDLIGLNKRCIFVPTPGQPEQEYLAKYLTSKKLCVSFSQKKFSLQKALTIIYETEIKSFEEPMGDGYKEVIEAFIKKLRMEN